MRAIKTTALTLALMCAALLAYVVQAATASAGDVPGAITGITVSNVNNIVTTDETWAVPNDTLPGDTFAQSVPEQFGDLPGSFPLKNSTGDVVANAVLSGSPGHQLYTFTLTQFVATHDDVHGTFVYTSGLDLKYSGTTQTLTYTSVDGGKFTKDVTVPKVVVNHDIPAKTGGVADSTTCSTTGIHCFHWQVETAFGPFDNAVITDTAGPDQTFDCASVVVHIGPTDSGSTGINDPRTDTNATIDCTPNKIVVNTGANPSDKEIVEVDFLGNVTDVPNGGNVKYHNLASFSTTTPGGTKTQTAGADLRSPTASGTGTGISRGASSSSSGTSSSASSAASSSASTSASTSHSSNSAASASASAASSTGASGLAVAAAEAGPNSATGAGGLAGTGAATAGLIVLASALLALGAGLVLTTRRRTGRAH